MQYGIEGRELTRNRMGSPEFQSVCFLHVSVSSSTDRV